MREGSTSDLNDDDSNPSEASGHGSGNSDEEPNNSDGINVLRHSKSTSI